MLLLFVVQYVTLLQDRHSLCAFMCVHHFIFDVEVCASDSLSYDSKNYFCPFFYHHLNMFLTLLAVFFG